MFTKTGLLSIQIMLMSGVIVGCGTYAQPGSIAGAFEAFKDCEDCPEMVYIPAGRFVMGASRDELSMANVPEPFATYQAPSHKVEIDEAFAIGKYPVTKAEFLAFVAATGREEPNTCWSWNVKADRYGLYDGVSWRDPGFDQSVRDPVVCVSWYDTQDYVRWLSLVTGAVYRLPSESEREYVGRSGSDNKWPWGNGESAICSYANVSDLSRVAAHKSTKVTTDTVFNCVDGYVYTSPVGTFRPNDFKIFDTVGNVWEWQADCFHVPFDGAQLSGAVVDEDRCVHRTLRGGSWFTLTFNNTPAARYGAPPDDRSGHIGFRVARSLSQ